MRRPSRQLIPVAGRVAAVTGGAHGIGRAIAAELARRGARVAIGDLDLAAAERAAAEIGVLALPLDVTRRDSFSAFLAATEERYGPVDVLVNNAGVMHVGPFAEESDDWTGRQIEINLHGPILGMKLALPAMVARGRGHVVNIASAAAKIGVRNEAVYSATKHGVLGVSEGVRHELRGTGVHVSVVMPGLVRTELSRGTLDARGAVVLSPEDVARAVAEVLERPRFDVFLPRWYDAATRVLAVLPRAAREGVLRALGAERATAGVGRAQRAAYEDRVAALYDRDG